MVIESQTFGFLIGTLAMFLAVMAIVIAVTIYVSNSRHRQEEATFDRLLWELKVVLMWNGNSPATEALLLDSAISNSREDGEFPQMTEHASNAHITDRDEFLDEMLKATHARILETLAKQDRYFALPWWRRIFTDWRKL